ncbi:MAG: InlB B-repeat-containing protein [Clostridia bacterium]|nr:InlB B-repeat-containing protein [Clostridia bacterium]
MKKQPKIILLSFLILVFSFSLLIGFDLVNNQKLGYKTISDNQVVSAETFDEDISKSYSYQINQNNSIYSVFGSYENQETYILLENSSFENIISTIDQDRLSNQSYQDCVISFNQISVGDKYLDLKNGKYTLTGKLTGYANSTNGLIFVNNNASVEISNAEFTNNANSHLIKNVSGGELNIYDGNFTANEKTIYNLDGGDINIFGGKIESKNSFAIYSTGTANINIHESASPNPTQIIGKSEEGAVYATSGAINISGGTITNNSNGYAVYSTNATISLSCAPIFETTAPQIYTQTKIVAQIGSQYYSGEDICINFGGEIVSATTILIEATNETYKTKFAIFNENYDIKFSNSNMVIFAFYSLIYNPNVANIVPPNDENRYFIGDIIDLQFLETEIRSGYTFLGWAETNNATFATYTEQGTNQLTFSNQTLYAVWQAIEYNITYILNDGEWGENVVLKTTYTCETEAFVLPKPNRTYYTFLGWTCENDTTEQSFADTLNNPNKVVAKGTIGNLIFTAHWELTVYKINYNGLTAQMISSLNLTTAFTIQSPSIIISNSDFLFRGYSFFGIYSNSAKTITFNGEVCFDETAHQSTNPNLFSENGNINFYVDTKIFHNGQGVGSEISPYIINSTNQFENFLKGYKKQETTKTFVKFANDINFNNPVSSLIFEPLNNYDINGNNKSINTTIYNTYSNYTSLFPYLKNCNLYNIKIKAPQKLQVNFGVNSSINFANVVGLGENTNLKNITNFVNTKLSNTATTQTLNIQVGGIIADLKGQSSLINNCQNQGNIDITMLNNNDINANCGMIAGKIDNSMIINSSNLAKIDLSTVVSNTTQYETCLFVAGIAIMDLNSSIINSFNQGDITILQESKLLAVASGVGIVSNTNCSLYNNYNLGNVSVKTTNSNNFAVPIVWSPNVACETDKYYFVGNTSTQKDFSNGKVLRLLNAYLANLNEIMEENFSNYSVQPKKWYFGFNLFPQFEETVLVHYNLNGIAENKSVVYYANEDLSTKYIPVSYRQNFFDGWFSNNTLSILADFDNITEPSLSLYAKWTSFENYVNADFTKFVILDILLLIMFLTALYFFDKKKTVSFFNNGKLIATTKVGRAKPITMPSGYENLLWFEDIRGLKPFLNKKMPFKKISLYTFNESKQQRMESKFFNDINTQKEELKKIVEEKQKQTAELLQQKANKKAENKKKLEEKQQKLKELKQQKSAKLAENKIRLKEAKQARKLAKQEKQNQKTIEQHNKTNQQKPSIQDKITIIKKEIKIIDPNEEK